MVTVIASLASFHGDTRKSSKDSPWTCFHFRRFLCSIVSLIHPSTCSPFFPCLDLYRVGAGLLHALHCSSNSAIVSRKRVHGPCTNVPYIN